MAKFSSVQWRSYSHQRQLRDRSRTVDLKNPCSDRVRIRNAQPHLTQPISVYRDTRCSCEENKWFLRMPKGLKFGLILLRHNNLVL
jgi:hypothetical protein